ncbi:uncharacterized protein LOC131935473 [Physella acuta]|uniref:uncharacterized protein LOC131935473 n=1 Tax=Physella acuta TaxID=109671 RepID=UPI0027DDE379|nr:uncharacterized protein LOC131935473 [Physella acuta]
MVVTERRNKSHYSPNCVWWQDFIKELPRVGTFRSFPTTCEARPVSLAENGFVYIGQGDDDTVVCVFCWTEFRKWTKEDDISTTHSSACPTCPLFTGIKCENKPIHGGTREKLLQSGKQFFDRHIESIDSSRGGKTDVELLKESSQQGLHLNVSPSISGDCLQYFDSMKSGESMLGAVTKTDRPDKTKGEEPSKAEEPRQLCITSQNDIPEKIENKLIKGCAALKPHHKLNYGPAANERCALNHKSHPEIKGNIDWMEREFRIELRKILNGCCSDRSWENKFDKKLKYSENDAGNEIALSAEFSKNGSFPKVMTQIEVHYLLEFVPPKVVEGILWECLYIEQFRLVTFCKYPITGAQSALVLAANGFVYIGTEDDDAVLCCFCCRGKKNWLRNEDVSNTHTALSPNCSMVTGINCKNAPIVSRVNGNYSFDQLVEILQNKPGTTSTNSELPTANGACLENFTETPGRNQIKTSTTNSYVNLQETPAVSDRVLSLTASSPVVNCPQNDLAQSPFQQPQTMLASNCRNAEGGDPRPIPNETPDAADVERGDTTVTLPRHSHQLHHHMRAPLPDNNRHHVRLRLLSSDITISERSEGGELAVAPEVEPETDHAHVASDQETGFSGVLTVRIWDTPNSTITPTEG